LAKLVGRGLCSSICPWCIVERTDGSPEVVAVLEDQSPLNQTSCGLG